MLAHSFSYFDNFPWSQAMAPIFFAYYGHETGKVKPLADDVNRLTS